MDYENIVLAVLLFTFFWVGYKVGAFMERLCDDENNNEVAGKLKDMHCFQCEIEMPVKEKNGRLYCSNCGLYHNVDYSVTEQCPHNVSVLRAIESVVTCETTALFCIECNEQISEPKIDC